MIVKKKTTKKRPLQMLNDYRIEFFNRLKGIDKITLILVALLFGIGVIMVYSITSISVYNGVKNDPSNFFVKTLIMGAAGLVAMLFIIALPYQFLKRISVVVMIVCPFLLLATVLFAGGSEHSDVKSWFEIGGFKLQPAEFVKIGMIMAVQYGSTRNRSHI